MGERGGYVRGREGAHGGEREGVYGRERVCVGGGGVEKEIMTCVWRERERDLRIALRIIKWLRAISFSS